MKKKQEALKRKLEEAKEEMKQKELSRKELPAEEDIGQQRQNEPEGEPQSRNRREKSEDERNLENVDKRWLKKQFTDRGCFWCKQPGHRAQECT